MVCKGQVVDLEEAKIYLHERGYPATYREKFLYYDFIYDLKGKNNQIIIEKRKELVAACKNCDRVNLLEELVELQTLLLASFGFLDRKFNKKEKGICKSMDKIYEKLEDVYDFRNNFQEDESD